MARINESPIYYTEIQRFGAAAVSGGRAVISGECLPGLNLVVMRELDFFEEQVGVGAHEGVVLGGDHRLDVMVLPVEAAEEIEYLIRLRDGLADVPQTVGELLEVGAVVGDAEVPLVEAAEFGLQDGALQFVVAEQAFNVRPDGEGGRAGIVDDIEDVLVDGCVEPVDEAAVDLTPFSGALLDGHRRLDEVVKDGVEEAPPLAIVGIQEIEENGDMGTDVHSLHHGDGGGLQSIEDGVAQAGRGGGVRRGGHGAGQRRRRKLGFRIVVR